MATPITAWHQEHVQFNRLLALMQGEMDRFHGGDDPDYALMLDILAYMREWADTYHHPREDEAFRRLLVHCPDRALPIARLLQEHRVIADAGETLRDLLEQAANDAIVARGQIETAAATYLVYYGNHIAKEEEDILPRAAESLDADDWRAVKEAAPLAADPVFGPEPQATFRELRRRLSSGAG